MQNSYFRTRLEKLGITQLNLFEAPKFGQHGKPEEITNYRNLEIFTPDENDNIVIHFYSLNGSPFTFKKKNNKWAESYKRTRLKVPIKGEHGDLIKYLSPKDSGMFPFFTPGILEKYKKKESIPVLYLIEGEFKAYKGYLCGMDIVGLPSIHGFYDSDSRQLHYELETLIVDCKVEKLVYITDADTLSINYEPGKDLAKRPTAFYNAVKNFREASDRLIHDRDNNLKDVYFAHILSEFNPDSKGLDDLLCNNIGHEESVIHDLSQLTFATKFFKVHNISDGNLKTLYQYFGLPDEKVFTQVYTKYIPLNKEFIFKRRIYIYDGKEVIYRKHKDTEEYMRIGDTWMRLIGIPNRHLELEESPRKWKVAEITRDYKDYKDFLDHIKKYKAFCNVPDPTENYKREHNGCYNIFNPVKYRPIPGDITNTIGFIKHLFQGEGNVIKTKSGDIFECANFGDPFTVALDYLTIMYRYPKQILPVPCLVSPENGTGKTTFLKWLKDIYGSNTAIIGNEQFKARFNSGYITKFIIGIDEGFIQADKKQEKERLKKLATDERQLLEMKGLEPEEIDFYGKLIICSNDADNLMKIEQGEIRWFIVRVPVYTKEDPLLRDKMRNEIPAFLDFLKNRKIFHPKEGRAWFNPKYIETEQLRRIISQTKDHTEKQIEDFIENMFLTYRRAVLRLPIDYIIDTINKTAKYRLDKIAVKSFLQGKKGMIPDKPQRVKVPTGYEENAISRKFEISETELQGVSRPYVFRVEQWLSKESLEEFNTEYSDEPTTEEEYLPTTNNNPFN